MVQRSNSTVEDTYYIETQEIFLDVDVLVLSELTKLHSSNVFYVHMIREVMTETFTEEDDLDDQTESVDQNEDEQTVNNSTEEDTIDEDSTSSETEEQTD